MRLPLVVFSLLVLLVRVCATLSRGAQGRRGGKAAKSPWNRIFRDALPAYVLMAALALTMFAFGKPTLVAQWGAWGVVLVQIVQSIAVWRRAPRIRRAARLLILADLIVMWAYLLPFFDPIPS